MALSGFSQACILEALRAAVHRIFNRYRWMWSSGTVVTPDSHRKEKQWKKH
jgi:hypothetical protein